MAERPRQVGGADPAPRDTELTAALRIDILGPMRVSVGGIQRIITARRQRAVLAYLALHVAEPVSGDRLLDAIWGEDLPGTGVRAVAFQISKLRSALEPDRSGEGTLITTSAAGYVLDCDRTHVDALRFERLVSNARAALPDDPTSAESLLGDASSLWRGRPFADLGDEPFVAENTRQLEQAHLLARRTLAEARIAQGRHTDAIGDLEVLITQHPLDEALVQLAMTALHMDGRTADALRSYGELRLRLGAELGIEPSHDLQRLERELLAGDIEPFGPIASRGTTACGIPASASSFVGRDAEITAITELLSSARVVTLCGFGGLGKTRLAQAVGATLTERFEDGVWYVDLTSIDDAGLLAETFNAGAGIDGGDDPVDRLLGQLANRDTLIVVDNCEHLVDDVAGLVTSIMRAAPRVRVLATSRVGLGISGEASWMVAPLDAASGVELFVDRARLAQPRFVVDDSNRPIIEHLCNRLDGIPLAIEMAAARLAVMNITQIVEHLDDRFRLLTRTGRGIDEKQRSLATVMDWSYRLLDEPDQTLLRRLSTCAGGFTLDAAASIGVPAGDDATLTDVLDRLGRLVEASLVMFGDEHGTPRYRMLETVRQYGAELLERHDSDDGATAALAHAAHYATVAVAVREMEEQDREAFLRLGDQDLGNFHAAINWAYTNGHPTLGLEISLDLWSYFSARDMRHAKRYIRTGLELVVGETPISLQAAALSLIDESSAHDDEFRAATQTRVELGLQSSDDPTLRSTLLRGLASSVAHTDPRAAQRYLTEAASLRPVPPGTTLAALNNLCMDSWLSGEIDDPDAVIARLAEVMDAFPSFELMERSIQAMLAATTGRWNDVVGLVDTPDSRDQLNWWLIATVHVEALVALDRPQEARDVLEQLKSSGDGPNMLLATALLEAPIHLATGDPAAAVAALAPVTEFVGGDSDRLAIAVPAASMVAAAACGLGQFETAAIWFGFSAAEQQRLDIRLRIADRPVADRAIETCRAELGDERFDACAALGATSEFRDLPRVELSSAPRPT